MSSRMKVSIIAQRAVGHIQCGEGLEWNTRLVDRADLEPATHTRERTKGHVQCGGDGIITGKTVKSRPCVNI